MTTSTINYINEFNAINKTSADSDSLNWFHVFEYFRFNEDGSFTVKRGENFHYAEEGLIWDLTNDINLDFKVCGEDGCINNFDMYTPLFNPMTNMLYLIPYSKQEEYSQMMEVTIYGREVSAEELREIYNYIGED